MYSFSVTEFIAAIVLLWNTRQNPFTMKAPLFLAVLLMPCMLFPQSDIDKVIRGGEIILGGLSILKIARSDDRKKSSKFVETICVKNKLSQKITFRLFGKDEDENEIKRELVVQKDGKECAYHIPKSIYTYEFALPSGEIYKKGEYKLEDEVTFTIKDP